MKKKTAQGTVTHERTNHSFGTLRNQRCSQGEIFGVALMFVVIIIGILLYGQIKALDPNREEDVDIEKRYSILAEGTLSTLLKTSTTCYVERGRDTLRDLINYCLEFSSVGGDPQFTCESGITINACSYSIEFLNSTLQTFFNEKGIGKIPYELRIDVPENRYSLLSNITLTNFGNITHRNNILNEENYRQLGFRRAPSGLRTWATSQRNIRFELYLYYN